MRLGVVGIVPGDPRLITAEQLNTVRDLGCTSANFHAPGDLLFEITSSDCQKVKDLYADTGLELAQFGIGYGECLFDPDAAVRDRVVGTIHRGIETGCALNAGVTLIRTGSLSPTGSYSPSPRNYESGREEQLIETLRRIADKAEAEGMTMVIETHVLTIMGSPEFNRNAIEAVGSDRMRVVMDFVNHFQSLHQVFNSGLRLKLIFDTMGPISAVGHIKDIKISDGLVLHIDEEVPGEGILNLGYALRRWEQLYPDGYMLIEHLPDDKIPLAVENVQRIAEKAGVEIW